MSQTDTRAIRFAGQCRNCQKRIQRTEDETHVGLGTVNIHLRCGGCGTTNWVSRKNE
jgi:hypothetical protein